MVQIKTELIIMSKKTLLSEIKVWPKLKWKIREQIRIHNKTLQS